MKRPFSPRSGFKTVILLLFVFCAALTVKAQLTDWTFVYSEGFPHDVWGCPGDTNNTPISAKVALGKTGELIPGANGYVWQTLDRNFFATINGGRMMGGNYTTQNCAFKAWGYGSFKQDPVFGGNILNAKDTLTATFSEPVAGYRMLLTGRYPQTFIITESGRNPVSVDINPIYNDAGQITSAGDVSVYLSGKQITGLTVKSTHPSYAFAIDNITVRRLTPYNPPANNPPPNSCNATTIARPAPQNITANAYDWTMHTEVTDTDGLVLTDVRLKGRLMAEKISVPYYNISTNQTTLQRGELRPNDSGGTLRSRLVYYKVETNDERLIVTATYAIDNISASQSCLSVTQRYEFLKEGLYGLCTPPSPGPLYSLNCSRWRALVNYDFKGNNGETLYSFNAAQRNHFQVNGFTNNSVGLFKDCDTAPPNGRGCFGSSGGLIFQNKLNPLFSENFSEVIINGKQTSKWDNMHQTYRSAVTEPLEHFLSADFTAGGCPECVHAHWRWGKSFGEHFNNGEPFLPTGTNQDLYIGVVKYRAGEEHPNNWLDLIPIGNPESIRTKATSVAVASLLDFSAYSKPEDVVYWNSAIGRLQRDELFSHYSFFIPSEANVTRPISLSPYIRTKNLLHLRVVMLRLR
jgi:hypothetical protein